jgi:hypothetical protein
MAKMFYTLEEAKNVLGRGEEEIKQYAREGRLREFRDGPRLMFKADQVEQLRSELSSGGDQVDLGVSDSGGMIDLVDTTGASGTSITLSDTGGAGTAFGTKAGTSAGIRTKEDTALAADLGLSGTAAGIPSPSRPSGSGISSGGSRAGINVFGTDDLSGGVDPSAQTAITAGQEINLESVGSGSGLLDLSRERDDTSLGAVLEEINPGAMRPEDTGLAGGVDLDDPRGGIDRTPMTPVYVQAHDPWAPAFGAAALAASGVCLFGVFALICGLMGTWPDLLQWFNSKNPNQPWLVMGISIIAVAIFFVGGRLIGGLGSGRTAR